MTEDDTFRVLARPGIHEMYALYISWWRSLPDKNTMLRVSFCKSYDWTWFEFFTEAKRAGYKNFS